MKDIELLALAVKATEKSYSPYSDCRVGAALLTKSGKVYTGTNIENAAFSPTVCAERVAFFKAVSEGETEFEKIAVVGGKNGEINGLFTPCGVCRQVMREFCDDDFIILLADTTVTCKKTTLGELLPLSFSRKDVEG